MVAGRRHRSECEGCSAAIPTWRSRCEDCEWIYRRAERSAERVLTTKQYAREHNRNAALLFVYCVGVLGDPDSPVKIGSSRDTKARMRTLQSMCPYELELLGQVPGDRTLEKLIHRHLRPCAVYGEWFARGDRTKLVLDLIRLGDRSKLEAHIRGRYDGDSTP